jgi:peptidoglycan/LPS O-acetylase OafA/YrhL
VTQVEASTASEPRNAQLDLLRLVALVGVIVYQRFGWMWTPIVIPFAALSFAVAGTLMTTSLDRSSGSPWLVLTRRARRVVLPVWGLAVVAVPLWCGTTSQRALNQELAPRPGGGQCCCGFYRCSNRPAARGVLHGPVRSGLCRPTYG